jgi:hypothetical protein
MSSLNQKLDGVASNETGATGNQYLCDRSNILSFGSIDFRALFEYIQKRIQMQN